MIKFDVMRALAQLAVPFLMVLFVILAVNLLKKLRK